MGKRFLSWPKFQPFDHPRIFKMIVNAWPPYLGAAIGVEDIADDWCSLRVAMKLHWYNRNYVNSHFGGSLFSMTDPFYMLMLMRNLGPAYVVWDMAARIQYLRPGRGKVSAVFSLDARRLEEIRQKAEGGQKVTELFFVDVFDERGEKVAAVKKTLYIRKKLPAGAAPVSMLSPAITAASWGKIEVAGIGPGKDWKLWPGGGRNWDWTEHNTGHFRGVQPEEVLELIDKGCRSVVLTTGRLRRLRVTEATIRLLESKGIQVEIASTSKGIALYNRLAAEGVAVGGLFHSTC